MITLSSKELSLLAINGFGAMQKQAELEGLISQVDKLKPERILEIGVGKGGTSWCWSKLSSVKLIISVDLPYGPWGGGPEEKSVKYITDNSNCPYIFIPDNSQSPSTMLSVKQELGDHLVDFLFIDGDHSYEGVRADYEVYSQLVRDGGLIAFHDICDHPVTSGCEVKKFWDELKLREGKETYQFISEPFIWGGIGVLVK